MCVCVCVRRFFTWSAPSAAEALNGVDATWISLALGVRGTTMYLNLSLRLYLLASFLKCCFRPSQFSIPNLRSSVEMLQQAGVGRAGVEERQTVRHDLPVSTNHRRFLQTP